MIEHGIGNFKKTGDICSLYIINIAIRFCTVSDTCFMYIMHYLMKPLINFFGGPVQLHGILRHFQSGGAHTARIGCFTGPEKYFILMEHIDCFMCGRHVGPLSNQITPLFTKF